MDAEAAAAIELEIPAEQVDQLHRALLSAREGLRGDLAEFPEQFPDAARALGDIAACTRLADAMRSGAIVADRDVRDLLRRLCGCTESANGDQGVLLTDGPLRGLLLQIEARRG